ncbi:hypothetical protein OSG_eHP34_00015 [environmental Halophage eHP-34]|nr:hypothetical protein OSG_eHP34_00015 [environmental Halophage eHP-34]
MEQTTDAPNEAPTENARGDTTLGAYKTIRSLSKGDKVRMIVKAESEGNGLEDCDDRREGWVATVIGTDYDSRKNLHTIDVEAESEFGDEGTGKVTYHTDKSGVVRNPTASNIHGSPMRFDAPVDIFRDDRQRTVLKVEKEKGGE